jgi:hypothetical protein
MWYVRDVDPFPTDFLAFQATRAGSALACPYSSSAEFEAAVIQSKLDAGAYGPKRYRRRRNVFYAAMAAAGFVVILLML